MTTTPETDWSPSESSSAATAETSTVANTNLPRKISNSEVSAWTTCRRQYYYAHVLSVAPKHYGPALNLGIIFHDCIRHYYEARLKGENHGAAQLAANQAIRHYAQSDAIVASKIQIMMMNYFGLYGDEQATWRPVEVEAAHEIPLTPDYIYTMRDDLLMYHEPTGEYWLWDHKTTYDFWSEDDFLLNLQFPKYIGTLRFNQFPVSGVLVNQIRTREKKNPTSDDLFRRTPVRYNEANIRTTLKEQIVASQEIVGYRQLPGPIKEQQAIRIGNKMVCRMCHFKSLCIAQLQGGDIDYILQTEYGPNTYDQGYNPVNNQAGDW